eukprot:jgi/Mesen1/8732/ME000052S08159
MFFFELELEQEEKEVAKKGQGPHQADTSSSGSTASLAPPALKRAPSSAQSLEGAGKEEEEKRQVAARAPAGSARAGALPPLSPQAAPVQLSASQAFAADSDKTATATATAAAPPEVRETGGDFLPRVGSGAVEATAEKSPPSAGESTWGVNGALIGAPSFSTWLQGRASKAREARDMSGVAKTKLIVAAWKEGQEGQVSALGESAAEDPGFVEERLRLQRELLMVRERERVERVNREASNHRVDVDSGDGPFRPPKAPAAQPTGEQQRLVSRLVTGVTQLFASGTSAAKPPLASVGEQQVAAAPATPAIAPAAAAAAPSSSSPREAGPLSPAALQMAAPEEEQGILEGQLPGAFIYFGDGPLDVPEVLHMSQEVEDHLAAEFRTGVARVWALSLGVQRLAQQSAPLRATAHDEKTQKNAAACVATMAVPFLVSLEGPFQTASLMEAARERSAEQGEGGGTIATAGHLQPAASNDAGAAGLTHPLRGDASASDCGVGPGAEGARERSLGGGPHNSNSSGSGSSAAFEVVGKPPALPRLQLQARDASGRGGASSHRSSPDSTPYDSPTSLAPEREEEEAEEGEGGEEGEQGEEEGAKRQEEGGEEEEGGASSRGTGGKILSIDVVSGSHEARAAPSELDGRVETSIAAAEAAAAAAAVPAPVAAGAAVADVRADARPVAVDGVFPAAAAAVPGRSYAADGSSCAEVARQVEGDVDDDESDDEDAGENAEKYADEDADEDADDGGFESPASDFGSPRSHFSNSSAAFSAAGSLRGAARARAGGRGGAFQGVNTEAARVLAPPSSRQVAGSQLVSPAPLSVPIADHPAAEVAGQAAAPQPSMAAAAAAAPGGGGPAVGAAATSSSAPAGAVVGPASDRHQPMGRQPLSLTSRDLRELNEKTAAAGTTNGVASWLQQASPAPHAARADDRSNSSRGHTDPMAPDGGLPGGLQEEQESLEASKEKEQQEVRVAELEEQLRASEEQRQAEQAQATRAEAEREQQYKADMAGLEQRLTEMEEQRATQQARAAQLEAEMGRQYAAHIAALEERLRASEKERAAKQARAAQLEASLAQAQLAASQLQGQLEASAAETIVLKRQVAALKESHLSAAAALLQAVQEETL